MRVDIYFNVSTPVLYITCIYFITDFCRILFYFIKVPCTKYPEKGADWIQPADNHSNISCYYISPRDEEMTFIEAKERCESEGAELLTIETEEENNKIDIILQVY